MALLRALAAVLVLGGVAWGQIGTPGPCSGAVTDRERFTVGHGRVKFHLRFHTDAGTFDARSVIKLSRPDGADASCTEGQAVDFVIDELTKERQQFLGP